MFHCVVIKHLLFFRFVCIVLVDGGLAMTTNNSPNSVVAAVRAGRALAFSRVRAVWWSRMELPGASRSSKQLCGAPRSSMRLYGDLRSSTELCGVPHICTELRAALRSYTELYSNCLALS